MLRFGSGGAGGGKKTQQRLFIRTIAWAQSVVLLWGGISTYTKVWYWISSQYVLDLKTALESIATSCLTNMAILILDNVL